MTRFLNIKPIPLIFLVMVIFLIKRPEEKISFIDMSKTIIDADKKGFSVNFKELVAFKDLFFVLAYRDLRVKYAQTFLGLAWSIIEPLATLVILTFVFGNVAKVNTYGVPHILFTLTGMACWNYFSNIMQNAGQSIIQSQNLIKKIYFPRLIIPLSKSLVGLVEYAIALALLIISLLWFQYLPSGNLIFFPLLILFNIMTSLGIGIWLSSLTIRFRDFQHIVPFLVRFGLYATPVAYPATEIPDQIMGIPFPNFIYYLNPMAGIIEMMRWSIFDIAISPLCWVSITTAVFLFFTGIWHFKRVEDIMPDIL